MANAANQSVLAHSSVFQRRHNLIIKSRADFCTPHLPAGMVHLSLAPRLGPTHPKGTRRLHVVATATGTASKPAVLKEGGLPDWVRAAVEEVPWRGGLEPVPEASYVVSQDQIDGEVPEAFRGTAFRIGAGRIRIGNHRYSHWFDGDGMMYSVTFNGPGLPVQYRSKYVRTKRFLIQEKAGNDQIAVKGAWTPATGGLLANFGAPTNPANTSVVYYWGKLLALCEGGLPIELDPVTLDTKGEFNPGLDGFFSAHFKIDPKTGELWNQGLVLSSFGLSAFAIPSSDNPTVTKSTSISLGAPYVVHDCLLSENYFAVLVPPYSASRFTALKSLIGLAALGQEFSFDSSSPTRLVIISRDTAAIVADLSLPTFSSYHVANMYEEDNKLHLLTCVHNGPREHIERQFANMYEARFSWGTNNELWDYTVDLKTWTFLGARRVVEDSPAQTVYGMEFPIINGDYATLKARYVYVAANNATSKDNTGPTDYHFNSLQKYDLETGKVFTHVLGNHPGRSCSEASFVPRPGATAEDDGYVYTFVYDSDRHATDVVIIDSQKFEETPVCTIHLPTHLAYTFHGWWAPGLNAAK